MASILKIDVLEQRYANSGLYLSGRIHGPQGDIINNGRVVLPGNFEANTFNVLESLDANTINANTIFLGGVNGKLEFDANTSTLKINNASLALQSDVSTLIENSYTKFTANSSITAGDLVSLLDNGKIEKTAEASVRTNSVGATTTFDSNASDNIYVQYDKTLNKVLVSYAVGSSSACYGVLGTVNADGSITFGTPLQITSQYNLMTGAIDPVQNRAVFTFLGDVYIAEISGNNLINLQSPITFDSSTENYNATIYDPNSGKIIIAYSDSASPTGRAGNVLAVTVNGNSITFGQTTVFEASNTETISLSIDNDTNKIIIGYSLIGSSARCVIATVSGTTITTSSPAVASPGTADFVKFTYASNGIVVAAFRDNTNSNYGAYSIGQISGNSITFGSSVVFNSATSVPIGLSYDNVNERISISYNDFGNSNYGTVKSGIIENGAITFEATDIFNSSATYEVFSVVDTTYNRILIGFKNGATGPGRINVYSTFGTEYKDNVDNYIGIAKDSIAATQEGSVFIIGDIADNQTSLTENQIYYVDKTGSLTTSKTEYSIVGRAVSNTSIQLLDNKPTLLTDLNIIDGTNSQVLTTYGNGSFYFAAASDPIAVSKTNTTNAILSTVTNVNDFRFDSDSGFDVVDLGAGAVKIQMNSTFKTLKVSGQSDLVATGLDTLELIGSGITITTDAVANPKTLTFTGASTLTDLGITDGSANQVLITDGLGNYSFANAASGGASTLTDLGIADGESDQVLTTDGNGSFFFGHSLSILNQDLIDGGEITELRDCRTVIDLGSVDTRLGYAVPEGSKTILLANDSTIVSSTNDIIISETNGFAKLENVTIDLSGKTDAIIVPKGTTAQRPSSPIAGMIRYNTELDQYELYDETTTAWGKLGDQPPTISSISPATTETVSGTTQFTVVGTNFESTGMTTQFVSTVDSTAVNRTAFIFDNSGQIRITFDNTDFDAAKEPYNLIVTKSSGLSVTKLNALYVDEAPVWSLTSTNIATILPQAITNVNIDLPTATDPEGDIVTYSGSNLPSGLSIDANTGDLSGNVPAANTEIEYTVTINAQSTGSDPGATQKTTTRQPTIIVKPVIENSLMFDGSSYLSKSTSDNSTNSSIKTWSFWVKRSVLGTNFYMTGGFKSGNSNTFDIYFHTDDTFSVQWGGSSALLNRSSAVFRDTSAWYHILVHKNSTSQSFYINGSLVSLATTNTTSSSVAFAENGMSVSGNYGSFIGGGGFGGSNNIIGYLANIHFIDGQALTPTSFGESINGVWLPKVYNPTGNALTDYGINGFHLTFAPSTISGTTVQDISGRGNDWTANGF